MNALIVGATVVERCDAKETVAVLGVVKRMAEVAVARGEPAIEDLASHEVVFDIPLTEAPGERTVFGLLEAHKVARVPRVFRIANQRIKEPPANFAGRIDDTDIRVVSPFQRTARGIIPGEAGALRRNAVQLCVNEVKTVCKFRIYLLNFNRKGTPLIRHAV